MINLFPFQQEGVKFLASRRRALLLDDMGLGKTIQAIAASDQLDVDGVNVICPASVRTQWRKNYAADSNSRRDFASYSYEHARDKTVDKKMCLVLDESHFLKNAASKRTQKILGKKMHGSDGIIAHTKHVWALTGTPMPKDASDLYAPLFAIAPGALSLPSSKVMSYWQFVKYFCKTRPGFGNSVQIYGSKNLDELKERMAPYCLRRTKEEVFPEWNKPVLAELWLEAQESVRAIDDSPEGRMMHEVFKTGGIDALMGLSDSVATIRRYMGILVVGPLVQWLLDQIDSGLKKVVVMCYHREVIRALADRLLQQGIASVIYWGGMTENQKAEAKRLFAAEEKYVIFIGQIDACGTGLDGLQHTASDMIFAEFSWIDDQNKQALGRLDRIGQKNPVLARFVGIEGSLHGDIMQAARRRAADNRTLFNS